MNSQSFDQHDVAEVKPAKARYAKRKTKSRGRILTALVAKFVAVIFAVAAVTGGYSAIALTSQIKGQSVQLFGKDGNAITEPVTLDGPINFLLVGSDARAGQGGGYGHETSVLADVIILLHISADRKNVVALSIPRDTLVPWPACPDPTGGPAYLSQTLGQINATIANGGPGCTLLTVEQLTGLKIPFLAMIGFKGVIEMSNAIGGVEVCVANDIVDPYTHLDLKAGQHTLLGKQALQFLRTRHGVGDGSDLSRISNQQVFLTSLMRKVKSQGVLTNPVYLYQLASAAARNMTLSSSLTDLNVMVGLASAIKDVELDNITFIQLPAQGGLPAPYSGRVMPVYEKANLIFAKLQNDQPIKVSGKNLGQGATLANPTQSPSASPSATAALDDFSGTNAATTTCSN